MDKKHIIRDVLLLLTVCFVYYLIAIFAGNEDSEVNIKGLILFLIVLFGFMAGFTFILYYLDMKGVDISLLRAKILVFSGLVVTILSILKACKEFAKYP